MTSQRGFTLIEMAMVLAVLGLLVGGGLMALGPLVERAHMNQTKTNMDQIESALVLFAIRNNRLPCPADGHLTNASVNYGLENGGSGAPTGGAACGTGANPVALAHSVIPWRTLGLDEQYSVDGWGNRISYFPANSQIAGVSNLVDGTAAPACPAGTNCTLCLARTTASTSTRETGVCDIATTGWTPAYPYGNYLAVYVPANPAVTELTTTQAAPVATLAQAASAGGRAAYVLISHGTSGWDGWNKAGNQITPPGGIAAATIKAFNNDGSASASPNRGFVQGPPQGSTSMPGTYFDDIVRWRSASMIIQLCGSGACGNP
jgi:prepilin-type N-terminal cleavage/methylation domain-containing protein